ncbi:MAG: hypothetical protein HQ559_15630, partial [Lentisphaerae bacterium]|nr:hypothetical protein [Lentisphaerota bacterium]
MPSEWTIQCSAGDVTTATPFADLSLGNLRISRVSQGIDSASFQAPSADYDGDALFPHGSNVTIRYGATIRFFGICKTIPRQGQPGAESITYRILGPWYWLKRVFETEWKMWDTVAGELQWKQKSRIILGQDRDGNAITTGEQIEEVLAYAIAQGAPLQVGSAAAWPALYVPWT